MTLPASMKFSLYYAADDVRVAEKPVPEIGPAEVLVRVYACGICGSDTMQWYRGPAVARMGGINSGHEIAGDVVAVGESVRSCKPGDRVVVVHHFPCMECTPCLDGNETACEKMRDKYIEPGGFSQYIRLFEKCVANGMFALPDTMSYEEGSFVEPLACVVRGVRKTAPINGRTVLIFGGGLAGLLHAKLTRHLGAARVTVVDTNPNRLAIARRAGADAAVSPAETLPSADRIYICTDSPKAAESALGCVHRGSHLLFFATDGPDKQLSLPLTRFWSLQPTISFSYGPAPRDMREALELIASGSVDVADLVTHRFGMDDIAEAFQIASRPRDNSLKVIVEPNRGHAPTHS